MTMASKALGAKGEGELWLGPRQGDGICASTMEIGSKGATGFLGSREQMLDIRRLQKRQVAMNDQHWIFQPGSQGFQFGIKPSPLIPYPVFARYRNFLWGKYQDRLYRRDAV
jgi:hypothetical protein